jgi:hypothetical protein
LNPQENIWDEIREKIFKNYALKSMTAIVSIVAKLGHHRDEQRPLIGRQTQQTGSRRLARATSDTIAPGAKSAMSGGLKLPGDRERPSDKSRDGT